MTNPTLIVEKNRVENFLAENNLPSLMKELSEQTGLSESEVSDMIERIAQKFKKGFWEIALPATEFLKEMQMSKKNK